jgi:hypothetical protein
MKNFRPLSLFVLFGLSVAGCATLDLDADAPSAMVAGRDVGPTEWQGVATGREMATTAGVMTEPLALSIDENGHFTLIHRQGTGEIRSEGDVTVSGNRLILDGHIVAPSSLAGAPVRHEIRRTERGMFGDVDTFFLGHRVRADLLLERTTL